MSGGISETHRFSYSEPGSLSRADPLNVSQSQKNVYQFKLENASKKGKLPRKTRKSDTDPGKSVAVSAPLWEERGRYQRG